LYSSGISEYLIVKAALTLNKSSKLEFRHITPHDDKRLLAIGFI